MKDTSGAPETEIGIAAQCGHKGNAERIYQEEDKPDPPCMDFGETPKGCKKVDDKAEHDGPDQHMAPRNAEER